MALVMVVVLCCAVVLCCGVEAIVTVGVLSRFHVRRESH
jgi:hypothetical protein